MTLTDILPTLRRSIPDPLNPRHWPEHTMPTTTDVIVGGVSLTRLIEVSSTPALLTGDLPSPRTYLAGARDSGSDVTVLIFRITLRIDTETGKRVSLTDCRFDRVRPCWEECRLIGRTSTARNTDIALIPGESGAAPWPYPSVKLPGDIHQGDLLTVPCAGAVALRDVRPQPNATFAQTRPVLEVIR